MENTEHKQGFTIIPELESFTTDRWTVGIGETSGALVVSAEVKGGEPRHPACMVAPAGHITMNDYVNAYLIAKAPELRAALKQMIGMMQSKELDLYEKGFVKLASQILLETYPPGDVLRQFLRELPQPPDQPQTDPTK